MAHLLLADPVDASKALLQSVGVPGQVVVHHQVCPLQVHALPGCIVGQQHHHLRVVHEGMHDLAASIAGHTAVDLHHRLRPSQTVADLGGQIHQGVLELGEQHQLAPGTIGLLHQRVIEDPVQLLPLGISALVHDLAAQLLQLLEGLDLELQLGQGLGGG